MTKPGSGLARDIMETSVVSVGESDPLVNIYRLFSDEEISGAPVVNDRGRVVGVLSTTDLIKATRDDQEGIPAASGFYRIPDGDSHVDWYFEDKDLENQLDQQVAGDVMTKEVVSVTPDTPISQVVEKVRTHRIHRILVLDPDSDSDGDHLVGIISLFDLVALLQ